MDDIIEDILSLDQAAVGQEDYLPEALDSGPSVRRKTSTDNHFLDSPPVVVVPETGFPWPPRVPSQEPEHFNPYDPSAITHVPYSLEEEVFEPDPDLVSENAHECAPADTGAITDLYETQINHTIYYLEFDGVSLFQSDNFACQKSIAT